MNFDKNCTKTFARIEGGETRVCGKPFMTNNDRRDWCDDCVKSFIAKSVELKASIDRYREEQRAAGRVKFAGRWTYDVTESEEAR
jgi:hypothetical protein